MKNIIYLIISLSAILLFAGMVLAQETPPDSSFEQLTLKLSSTKEEFVQLEPIPVILSLSNNTNHPLLGHSVLQFTHGPIIQVFVTHNEETKEMELSYLLSCISINKRIIQPGEHYNTTQALKIGLSEIFYEPGLYNMQVILHDADFKYVIRSNPVSINILAATGTQAEAIDYIKYTSNPAKFFTPLELNIPVLEQFLVRFKGTAQWNYVALLLGQTYSSSDNKDEHIKALHLFEQLSKDKNFVFADGALTYAVDVSMKLGETEHAKQFLQTLKSLYPDSPSIIRAEQLIEQSK
ncbi:MAG: hypothetical protein HYR87_07525 [Thaumarchaeota archaeon]|nr:hypothetical protein [Nitrososphaerota archaeon]